MTLPFPSSMLQGLQCCTALAFAAGTGPVLRRAMFSRCSAMRRQIRSSPRTKPLKSGYRAPLTVGRAGRCCRTGRTGGQEGGTLEEKASGGNRSHAAPQPLPAPPPPKASSSSTHSRQGRSASNLQRGRNRAANTTSVSGRQQEGVLYPALGACMPVRCACSTQTTAAGQHAGWAHRGMSASSLGSSASTLQCTTKAGKGMSSGARRE